MLGKAVELTVRPSRITRSEMCCRWQRQQRDRLTYDPFLPAQGPRRKEGAGSQFLSPLRESAPPERPQPGTKMAVEPTFFSGLEIKERKRHPNDHLREPDQMPWTPNDAERHTRKAATPTLKELWAKVANESLQRTGDEGRAIREANAVVARQAGNATA
jgi:hypothetical protein